MVYLNNRMGFPCGSAGKESTGNVGDLGSTPRLGRSPGEGKGYPLQYSGLENSMDWVTEWFHFISLQTTEYLQTKFNSTLRLIHMIKWDLSWDTKMVVVLLWKSLSCLTLCNPVHGILQARILEWVAFSFSRGSSQPRKWTQVYHIAGGFFTSWAIWEAQEYWRG